MTNFKRQIFSVIAAGSLLVSVATPAFASTTIQILGNGAGSTNAVVANQTNTNTVTQSNYSNVTNNVTSNAKTGGNEASFNTGGNTTVKTGDATTTANVTNTLNSNAAQVAGCNCGGNTAVTIAGNGAYSQNQVNKLGLTNTNTVGQSNTAYVSNTVKNNAKTGGNEAEQNTGGNTTIVSGNATSNATVNTTANSNSAVIGGGSGTGTNPTASFKIVGNGAGSTNWIGATLANTNRITQDNYANITNDVRSNAKTGGNDAGFNTGGDVVIKTGNADANATVGNSVNFNSANLDCGCTWDVLAKIAGNGANPDYNDSSNGITLGLSHLNTIGSGNTTYLYNPVHSNAKTGGNEAGSNTGSVSTVNDPSVITGDATTTTGVNNSGNVNTVGGTPFVIPMGNTNLGLSFNIQALLAFFGLSMSN